MGDQILEIDRVTQELSLAGRLDIVLIKSLYEFFKCYKLDLRFVPVVLTFWPQQCFRLRKRLNHKIVRAILFSVTFVVSTIPNVDFEIRQTVESPSFCTGLFGF